MKYLYLYLAMVPVFFVIDFLWINYFAEGLYQKNLKHLLGEVNMTAAIGFYLIYILGIILFGVLPGIQSGQWQQALLWGALFGFFTYATYDLTNMATLKDWPLKVVVIDIAWGTILCASVATAGFFIAQTLKI